MAINKTNTFLFEVPSIGANQGSLIYVQNRFPF